MKKTDFYINYKEAGPLRRHKEAKAYFLNNIALFIKFAISLYLFYKNLVTTKTVDVDRIDMLAAHIAQDNKKWIDLLEGKNDQKNNPLIDTLSKIIARILVGHETEFGLDLDVQATINNIQKIFDDFTISKNSKIQEFKDRIVKEFGL